MKNTQKYINKSILSIDWGTKNIGLCLFNNGRDPFPLPFAQIPNLGNIETIEEIRQIYSEEVFDLIILGLPKHKDGSDSEMTKLIRKFKGELEKRFQKVLILFQDEALSSFEAEERMKNSPRYNFKIDKSQLDALAAVIILEEWLDSEAL